MTTFSTIFYPQTEAVLIHKYGSKEIIVSNRKIVSSQAYTTVGKSLNDAQYTLPQAAINFLSAGGTIQFKNGIYDLSGVTFPPGVSFEIIGETLGKVIFINTLGDVLTAGIDSNVVLRNIVLRPDLNNWAFVSRGTNKSAIISINDCWVDDLNGVGNANGFFIEKPKAFTASKILADKLMNTCMVWESESFVCEDSTFSNVSRSGIKAKSDYINIRNNQIDIENIETADEVLSTGVEGIRAFCSYGKIQTNEVTVTDNKDGAAITGIMVEDQLVDGRTCSVTKNSVSLFGAVTGDKFAYGIYGKGLDKGTVVDNDVFCTVEISGGAYSRGLALVASKNSININKIHMNSQASNNEIGLMVNGIHNNISGNTIKNCSKPSVPLNASLDNTLYNNFY